jgi:hypothetical protein
MGNYVRSRSKLTYARTRGILVFDPLGHYRIAAIALQYYRAAPSPTTTNGAQ